MSESGLKIKRVSDKLINFIKLYEGENGGLPVLHTYHGGHDRDEIKTIAWGHSMANEEEGVFTFSDGTVLNLYTLKGDITLAQAQEILEDDISKREEILNATLEECVIFWVNMLKEGMIINVMVISGEKNQNLI